MFITVRCPKCGRNIKAKKKFVLGSGGIPCLKCKVRIPVSKEQVEAYREPEGAEPTPEEAAPAAAEQQPEQSQTTTEAPPAPVPPAPEPEAAPEPKPIPEAAPEPSAPSQVYQAALVQPEEPGLSLDEEDHITAAIAVEPPTAPAETEPIPPVAGAQIVFTCPQCSNQYPLKQALAGKKIRCKGCSRIVRVAPDSPPVPGSEPQEAPLPAPPPPEEDIPIVYSVGSEPVAPPPSPPPPPPVQPPQAPSSMNRGGGSNTAELRMALSNAEERAASAEELLQKAGQDKTAADMANFRKIRDLEGQVRDLTARLKAKEDESHAAGTLKKSDVEGILKSLCDELDSNFQQELASRKNLMDDLKRQLKQLIR